MINQGNDLRKSYENSEMKRETAGNLEAFFHENQDGTRFILTVFRGKARKPFYNYRIPGGWEKRQRKWDEMKESHLKELAEKEAEKKKIAELKKTWRNPYKAGDIFSTSWGYDQTNLDFYQVVKVNAKSLVMRPIASERAKDGGCSMSEYRSAVKDAFDGEEFAARITFSRHLSSKGELMHSVVNRKVCECASFRSWDGKPAYCSWYA